MIPLFGDEMKLADILSLIRQQETRAGLQKMPPFPPELKSRGPLNSELWPRIVG